MPAYRLVWYDVITCYTARRSDTVLAVSLKHVADTYRISFQCVLWLLESKKPSSLNYWCSYEFYFEAMLQFSSSFYFFIFLSACFTSTSTFCPRHPRHGNFLAPLKSCYPTSQCCWTPICQFLIPTPNPTLINSPCVMVTLRTIRQ